MAEELSSAPPDSGRPSPLAFLVAAAASTMTATGAANARGRWVALAAIEAALLRQISSGTTASRGASARLLEAVAPALRQQWHLTTECLAHRTQSSGAAPHTKSSAPRIRPVSLARGEVRAAFNSAIDAEVASGSGSTGAAAAAARASLHAAVLLRIIGRVLELAVATSAGTVHFFDALLVPSLLYGEDASAVAAAGVAARLTLLLLSTPTAAIPFDASLAPLITPLFNYRSSRDEQRSLTAGDVGVSALTALATVMGSSDALPPLVMMRVCQLARAALAAATASSVNTLAQLIGPAAICVLVASDDSDLSREVRGEALALLRDLADVVSKAPVHPGATSTAAADWRSITTALYGRTGSATAAHTPATTTAFPMALVALIRSLSAVADEIISGGTLAGDVVARHMRGIAASADVELSRTLISHATAALSRRPSVARTLLRVVASAGVDVTAATAIEATQWAQLATIVRDVAAAVDAASSSLESRSGAPFAVVSSTSGRPSSIYGPQIEAAVTALALLRVGVTNELVSSSQSGDRLTHKGSAASHAAAFVELLLPLLRLPVLLVVVPLGLPLSETSTSTSTSLLPATLAALTGAELWHFASDAPVATRGSSSGARLDDRILAALLDVAVTGSAGAASGARHALGRLAPLSPAQFIRYAVTHGLSDGAPAAAGSSADAGFRHAAGVTALLQRVLGSADASVRSDSGAAAAKAWVARVTVFAEFLVSALPGASSTTTAASNGGNAAPSALPASPDLASLVAPLSSTVEALVGLGAVTSTSTSSVTLDDSSGVEYAKQLLLGAMRAIATAIVANRRSNADSAWVACAAAAAAEFDVALTTHCVMHTRSTQTRGAALLLLGAFSSLSPGPVLAALLPLLGGRGAALVRDDSNSLALLARLVEVAVPAIAAASASATSTRAGGASTSIQSMLAAFASGAPSLPPHRRAPILSALLSAVARAESAAEAALDRNAGRSGRRPSLSGSGGGAASTTAEADALGALRRDAARHLPSLVTLLLAQPAPPATDGAAAALTATAVDTMTALGGALASQFTPLQQVRSLAVLVGIARRLLQTNDDMDDADATSGDTERATPAASSSKLEPAPLDDVLAAAMARLEAEDARALLRELTAVPALPSAAQGDVAGHAATPLLPTRGARLRLAAATLSYVGAQLGAPHLTVPAAAIISAAPNGRGSDDLLQTHLLLLAERLHGVVGYCAAATSAATRRRAEAAAEAKRAAEDATRLDAAAAAADASATAAATVARAAVAATAPGSSRKRKAGNAAAVQCVPAEDAASLRAAAAARRAESAAAARAAAGHASLRRFWIATHDACYGTALRRLAALLTPAAFVAVSGTLLRHAHAGVRHRALAFFNDALRSGGVVRPARHSGAGVAAAGAAPADDEDMPLYLSMLPALTRAMVAAADGGNSLHIQDGAVDEDEDEDEEGDGADGSAAHAIYAQTALDTVAALAGYFARAAPEHFMAPLAAAVRLSAAPVIAQSQPARASESSSPVPVPVRASALIAAGALCTNIGARVLPHLSTLVPAAISALEWSATAVASGSDSVASAVPAEDIDDLDDADDEDGDNRNRSSGRLAMLGLALASLTCLRAIADSLPAFLSPYLPALLHALTSPAVAGNCPPLPRLARFARRCGREIADLTAEAAAAMQDAVQGAAVGGVYDPATDVQAELPTGVGRDLAALEATGDDGEDLKDDVNEASATIAAAARGMTAALATAVSPRVLLPPLLLTESAWPAASGARAPPAARVHAVTAVRLAAARLTRAQARELAPRIITFVASALDGRWRGAAPSDVAAVMRRVEGAPRGAAATRLAAAAAAASAVEVEALPLLVSTVMALPETAARTALAQLIAWAAATPDELHAESVVTGDLAALGLPPLNADADDDDDVAMAASRGVSTGATARAGENSRPVSAAAVHSAYFAFAALCRRIALCRAAEALAAVVKGVFLPLFTPFLNAIGAELSASAAAASAGASGMATASKATQASTATARGASAPAHPSGNGKPQRGNPEVASAAASTSKRRVRFDISDTAGDSNSNNDSSDDDDNEEEDVNEEAGDSGDDEDDGDNDEAQSSSGGPVKASSTGGVDVVASTASGAVGTPHIPYALLFPLDECAWNPPATAAEDEGAASSSLSLVPSTPHGLRCAGLAALRAAFAADTLPDPLGFMSGPGGSRGGTVARERLDAVLRPLTAQLALPLLVAQSPGSVSGEATGGDGRRPAKLARRAIAAAEAPHPGVPGGVAGYDAFIDRHVVPMVRALTAALRRDTLWKPLCNAILMRTRDERARVRAAALRATSVLFDEGGAEALTLMPETLPFLAETQHDEDAGVEAAVHALLTLLEERSGEDLQAFLV